ncbi:hypothetical protein CYY_010482 [Polysphondylium violaceum]|uniref:Uncharacterized protein n=1 Tax=Polysphondylium violaceum TaxID=133409 RepID=A0A8J4UNN3_9MYCE|nr:hypothetical protein CYY_010482 [Polysphondylium violaceum]
MLSWCFATLQNRPSSMFFNRIKDQWDDLRGTALTARHRDSIIKPSKNQCIRNTNTKPLSLKEVYRIRLNLPDQIPLTYFQIERIFDFNSEVATRRSMANHFETISKIAYNKGRNTPLGSLPVPYRLITKDKSNAHMAVDTILKNPTCTHC